MSDYFFAVTIFNSFIFFRWLSFGKLKVKRSGIYVERREPCVWQLFLMLQKMLSNLSSITVDILNDLFLLCYGRRRQKRRINYMLLLFPVLAT